MAWLPKTIKTKRTYTVDEVFETLKRESELPEPYIYDGLIGGPAIYIPGEKDNDIQVLVKESKITITNAPRPGDVVIQVVRDTILRMPALFRGVNDRLFVHTIRECIRLFGPNKWSESEVEYKAYEKSIIKLHDRKNPFGLLSFIASSFFLVFSLLMVWWITEMHFAYVKLPGWKESTAAIEEVWLERELVNDEHKYEVVIGFRLSFQSPEGIITINDWVKNTGSIYNNVIPDSAYKITGLDYNFKSDYNINTTAICYDPNNPQNYRFGEWEHLNNLYRDPTGLFVIGIPMFLAAIPVTRGLFRVARQKTALRDALQAIPGNREAIINDGNWTGWFAIFVVFGIISIYWLIKEIYLNDYVESFDYQMLCLVGVPALIAAILLTARIVRAVRQKRALKKDLRGIPKNGGNGQNKGDMRAYKDM